MDGSPSHHPTTPQAAAATSAWTPAMPSVPSMKLKALMKPAIQSTVTTVASTPAVAPSPGPGTPSASGPSRQTANAAAVRCTISRVTGDRPRKSSSRLTSDTTVATPSTTMRSSVKTALTAAMPHTGTTMPTSSPRPPRRGVGRTCELRSLGRSSTPWRSARSRMRWTSSPRRRECAEADGHDHRRATRTLVDSCPGQQPRRAHRLHGGPPPVDQLHASREAEFSRDERRIHDRGFEVLWTAPRG